MAWTSGFFNSVNGDRLYNADQMSRIFEGLITDGVYESVGNKMAVQPNNGMVIQIGSGRGWFNKHWVENDSDLTLTIADSDVLLNRYVAVVVRVDETDAVRDVTPHLKYSEFATNPVKPSMERSTFIKEYCLAYIYIRAGARSITASDIEDTRGDDTLCGWVTGLIEQLSTATLFTQFTAVFNDWFSTLQDLINENTEVMLVNALPTSDTVTLEANGWVSQNGAYTQTVQVTNMSATKSVMVTPSDDSVTDYSASEIRCTDQGANTLTFTAITKPVVYINVDVLHMGV